ncbi:MAG: hypothetical protein P9L91_09965, partial [Candidatus Zophobacter franzmannii]|nr:hypothetical protein [Candidatus Zophobacter franzmannii]
MSNERLLAKQFIITETEYQFPQSFNEYKFSTFRVLTGKDVHLSRIAHGDAEAILIGDWYNYRLPELDNQAILEKCFVTTSITELIQNTIPLCG